MSVKCILHTWIKFVYNIGAAKVRKINNLSLITSFVIDLGTAISVVVKFEVNVLYLEGSSICVFSTIRRIYK